MSTELSQNPLASPSAAESHESRVVGADSRGVASPASALESSKPKKVATRTLPSLIGRNNQRSGMRAAVFLIDAARSSVRFAQLSSFAQSVAYRPICSSVVLPRKNKLP